MTVTGKPMPPAQTILTAIDEHAQATMKAAERELGPVVAGLVPRGRTRKLADGLRPKTTRTARGTQISVQAPRGKAHDRYATIADVVRWVNRGTGIHRAGPGAKRRVRSRVPGRKMTLPGGAQRTTVAGQRPNPFMARIVDVATPRIERATAAGARGLDRVIDRAL